MLSLCVPSLIDLACENHLQDSLTQKFFFFFFPSRCYKLQSSIWHKYVFFSIPAGREIQGESAPC